MKNGLKRYFMKVSSLVVTVLMLFSIVKMPVTYAYFTSGAPRVSEGLEFLIFQEGGTNSNIQADVTIARPFLFEEEDQDEPLMETTAVKSEPLSMDTMGTFDLQAEEDQETSSSGEFRPPYPGETVEAEITVFEEGFSAAEIFIPSVKLHHGEKLGFALQGEIVDDGLVATFDLYQVWTWFKDMFPVPQDVTLQVSGEGYRQEGDVFFFTGETTIPLKGTYDVREIQIIAPDLLFIPEDQHLSHTLKLKDQDGLLLEDAAWFLLSASEGVSLNEETGVLKAFSEAAGENIRVEARLESQGRLHQVEKEIALYPYPDLEIAGADSITVPLPWESTSEPYELLLTQDFDIEKLIWALSPDDIDGIQVDEEGLVTVIGEARENSLLLQAQVVILDEEFTAEKIIELETIPIGAVSISGDTDHIIIPQEDRFVAFYTATVFDTENQELPEEPVFWYLEAENTLGLDLDYGQLTVEPYAEPGPVALIAFSARDPEVEGVKLITLEAPPEPEPEEEEDRASGGRERSTTPEPEEENDDDEDRAPDDRDTLETPPSLQIEGEPLLFIPADEPETAFYRAVSETGDTLTGVHWMIDGEEEPEGIFLNEETGELTLEPWAREGVLTLKASLTVLLETEDGEREELLLTDQMAVELVNLPEDENLVEENIEEKDSSEEKEEKAKLEEDEDSEDGEDGQEEEDKDEDDKDTGSDETVDDEPADEEIVEEEPEKEDDPVKEEERDEESPVGEEPDQDDSGEEDSKDVSPEDETKTLSDEKDVVAKKEDDGESASGSEEETQED